MAELPTKKRNAALTRNHERLNYVECTPEDAHDARSDWVQRWVGNGQLTNQIQQQAKPRPLVPLGIALLRFLVARDQGTRDDPQDLVEKSQSLLGHLLGRPTTIHVPHQV